jgi:TRAP-type C4-dicarboxylate transport system substrate-binding protein
MRKSSIVGIGLPLALAAFAASAQPVTFRLETYAGPNHVMNTRAWPEWAKRLEKASGGEMKVQVSYPPVDPRLLYDRAIDGIADIIWSSSNYSTGRFVLAEVADLPGLGGNAQQRSVAFWRTHEQFFKKHNEYKRVALLTVFAHGPGMLHSRKEVASLKDLNGLKVRLAGQVQSDLAKALGVVGVSAPVTKANEMLMQGVVDGVLFSIETIWSFKLADALKYHYEFPGGLYGSGFFTVMNEGKYNSLTPKQKEILATVTGETMAALMGEAWDSADALAVSELKKRNHVIGPVPAAMGAEVAKLLEPIEAGWIKKASAEGLADPRAALAHFRAEVKKQGGK